jgi:hypothetical protein
MKRFTLTCIVLLYILTVKGQESNHALKIGIKIGYTQLIDGNSLDPKMRSSISEYKKHFRFETNYCLSKNIEIGGYIGYSSFWGYIQDPIDTFLLHNHDYKTLFYGLNTNFHILPFFIGAKDFRFDLYVTGKVGGMRYFGEDGSKVKGNMTEYGAGPGMCFYPTKHIGIFAEYSFGKYRAWEKRRFLAGLSLKF